MHYEQAGPAFPAHMPTDSSICTGRERDGVEIRQARSRRPAFTENESSDVTVPQLLQHNVALTTPEVVADEHKSGEIHLLHVVKPGVSILQAGGRKLRAKMLTHHQVSTNILER